MSLSFDSCVITLPNPASPPAWDSASQAVHLILSLVLVMIRGLALICYSTTILLYIPPPNPSPQNLSHSPLSPNLVFPPPSPFITHTDHRPWSSSPPPIPPSLACTLRRLIQFSAPPSPPPSLDCSTWSGFVLSHERMEFCGHLLFLWI
ncbi:hypothetical protein BaRGS_00009100 [Batillaria attramentaria]|uniref:Uncharacterized protein n=1 Tax=Batillaria attramentaria TaxID=370345 RepID=A0ABD0LJR1_9CAEN